MAEREAPVLEDPAAFYPDQQIQPHRADVRLEGGDTVEVAGLTFDVVEVPGHSPGHIAFATDGMLFSGDVLFAGSVGRTDLPFADWDTLVDSIRLLLDRFPPETVVYPGHGPPTTLGTEQARNPFLAELRPS
jgi:glyoxylase-like metal-dependent hydrolase (beta-lactamase superfamily II)